MVDLTHNLQTPLTVLKSELSLLHKENKIQMSDAFSTFEKSLDNVSNFITRLLHLSHKQLHTSKQMRKLNLSNHLEEISEYLKTIVENDDIIYISSIEKGMYIIGDSMEIEELITNLISNAIKYRNPKNQPNRIELNAYIKKEQIIVKVIDNGIGIKSGNIRSVFKRFYRAEKEQVSGNGLGLAICKRIVERHHGEIAVTSILGQGSTFSISFPHKMIIEK